MIREVFMPALSSTMTEGKIVSWAKSAGDKVEKGETVVVVESDKADMDVESFYEGYLAIIITEAGEMAQVNDAIAFLADTEAEIEEAKQGATSLKNGSAPSSATATTGEAVEVVKAIATPTTSAATAQNGIAASETTTGTVSGRTIVSPRARKLAQQLKVDLSGLQGSGPHGRIVAQDVELAAGQAPTLSPTATMATPTMATPAAATKAPTAAATATFTPSAATPTTPGELVAFNTLQQAVVRSMDASLSVPVFRVGYTITTNALDKLYQQIKPKGVTMTALLAKAVAVTLTKHPLVNARFAPTGIQYSSSINIAVAVAMPDGGLITPVLRGADQMDIYSLSRTWKDLVARSRTKQLAPEEYNSGTFTLSNLGMFGVDSFDAILPPGQGSILAIGGARPQVVATADGLFGTRNQMRVNMTSDHRIIYGADGAAFLKDLCELIENNAQSLTL